MLNLAQIQPVADRVLILRDNMPEKTKDGLIIPATAKNTKKTGTVMKAGPESTLKPNDKIYFLYRTPLELATEKGNLLAIPEIDVIAQL